MKDILNRLQRIKMILLSLLLTVAGTLLLITDQTLVDQGSWSWSDFVPWSEFGGILVGAGLLGIWIDHLFRREQEAANDARLRTMLAEHAPAMRDAVLQAFAANQEDLARIATPKTLDQIVTNSLGLRLDDTQFANEIYADIKQQAIDIEERWEDASVFINVVPHEVAAGYFTVVSRWEYTVIPKHLERRFICLSDRKEYAELAQSHSNTSAWYRKLDDEFPAGSPETFKLFSFTVDGEDRPIKRSSRKAYQQYTAFVGADSVAAGEAVTISYTTSTVTRASGHLLFFDIEQPTNGINISFDYTGTDIATVSAVDLIQSIRPSRIEHTPDEVKPDTLRVEIDGWVFPRSGVAFVWTLTEELAHNKLQH